ncbi:hypothetical protein [Nonomuraea ceibae]|uniref:hypothetical protein n=1 Tax=Nonomuraea ceibae TaxID=1935170 RepID=UPI001C5E6E2A|nr:hypothetical protein [Nonomuraea ceibae]
MSSERNVTPRRFRPARYRDFPFACCSTPASYYREIVFGLRRTPYIAVRRPAKDGKTLSAGPWAWSDSIGSWTWPS